MAKKKAAKSSSPRKRGNAKPKRRLALDDDTSEAELQAVIDRQRKAIERGDVEQPPDPNDLVETLLDVPNRKPLEDPGPEILSNNGLVRFVHDKPLLYKKFIGQLREGATLNSAIFSSKFCNPTLVKKWINQGMKDAEEEKPILDRLALHAFRLSFETANHKTLDIEAPLPRDMNAMLKQCRKWLKK